jgi:methylglutaconyl-CoA hydratase
MSGLLESIDARGVATLTLNRPERHNALDDALIAAMTSSLTRLDGQSGVRVVVLQGAGESFCAGADIAWMKRAGEHDFEANVADAGALAELMQKLDLLSKPTVAVISGAAYGGGVGLVACCDVAIASDRANFRLSEAKLGIIPAVIGPFVIRAIGARQARRYFLTAEQISASRAKEIGLVHEVFPEAALEKARDAIIEALLSCAPGAQAEAKSLVSWCEGRPIDAELARETARRIATRRASPEGREGLNAFLEKRAPNWRPVRIDPDVS